MFSIDRVMGRVKEVFCLQSQLGHHLLPVQLPFCCCPSLWLYTGTELHPPPHQSVLEIIGHFFCLKMDPIAIVLYKIRAAWMTKLQYTGFVLLN
jgi:hypothetical protein